MVILLYAVVTFGYLGMAVWAWFEMAPTPLAVVASGGADLSVKRTLGFPRNERIVIALLWLAHLWLLKSTFFDDEGWRFGFALGLSATMALSVAVLWFESFYFEVASMRLLVLPVAAICAILPVIFPGSRMLGAMASQDGVTGNPAFDAHLIVALLAYGLLTIAAIQALVMTALDRWLHGTMKNVDQESFWPRVQRALLAPLPPLLALERVLFRLLALGFALLTLTVLTGVVFSEELFSRPARLDEKTVFTAVAWLIFGALLLGRALYGWRGRIALRWTLAGFTALFLAYAGSRFVIEVVLHQV
jgi:ABC-type uncharacterized transport system permease subunit